MKRLGLIVTLLGLFATADGQELQISDVSFFEGGERAMMMRVDLRKFALKVIPTVSVLKIRPTDPTLEKLGPILARSIRGDFALTSGGLNHEDPLDPAGLLVADSVSLAPLASTKGARNEVAGILCISDQGKPSILSIAEYKARRSTCAGAIQAGPIVILTRNPSLAELPSPQQDTSRSARLVVCESQEAADEVVFYYYAGTTLAGVRRSLENRCTSALNLAGSRQAGISVWHKDIKAGATGTTSTPLPSMIAVVAR